MTTEARDWIGVQHRSEERLSSLVSGLVPEALEGPSYCSEWSIAQLLSHLGSQAEIFSLVLDAGLSGSEPPGPAAFGPIWDVWNAKSPAAQAGDSIAANEALDSRLDALGDDELASVRVGAFGMELDLAGMCSLRLGEHAVHTWDLAVMLDPAAVVLPEAVELLVDTLPLRAARVGKPAPEGTLVAVTATDPRRELVLDTGGVSLEPGAGGVSGASIELSAEALLRLVYGRLDAAHTPALRIEGVGLDELRSLFGPGTPR